MAFRAKELGISCWTVEHLATVVEVVEKRQITAQDILEIVLSQFSPADVTLAVEQLVRQPVWERQQLYRAILQAFKDLEGRLKDRPRTVDMIAGEVSRRLEFAEVTVGEIDTACREIASASLGGLVYRDGKLILNVAYDELARRVSGLTKLPAQPRRTGSFRE